jgi:hypothetical protein
MFDVWMMLVFGLGYIFNSSMTAAAGASLMLGDRAEERSAGHAGIVGSLTVFFSTGWSARSWAGLVLAVAR